jgi:hypothetical protein
MTVHRVTPVRRLGLLGHGEQIPRPPIVVPMTHSGNERITDGDRRAAASVAEVRAWARAQGIPVSPRGRLADDVIGRYIDAVRNPALREADDEELISRLTSARSAGDREAGATGEVLNRAAERNRAALDRLAQ